MKPGIIAGLLILALVGVGALAFVLSAENNEDQNNTSTQQSTATETPDIELQAEGEPSKSVTAQEVAARASANDCWTIIDGVVYDITQYIPRHPGGSEILAACGTDGSSLFNNRTSPDGASVGSGTPHSPNAASQLASFKIGNLDTAAE